jgi:hypothetical protein
VAFGLERANKGDGMDELSKLGIKYGTDKIGKHNYLPVYYDLFKDRRNTVKKVLEIGTAEGAGLFMFREFFLAATIYGAEIDQKRVDLMKGEDRIEVYKCDQTNENDLDSIIEKIGSDIDFVIDDGSHKPEDQVFTCLELMPLLNKEVTYVIEDVAKPEIAEFLRNKYECAVVEVGKRYDDRLIIVRHEK